MIDQSAVTLSRPKSTGALRADSELLQTFDPGSDGRLVHLTAVTSLQDLRCSNQFRAVVRCSESQHSPLCLALAGCAAAPRADMEAKAQAVRDTAPTCREAKECEVKWSAAREWVTHNAGYRLQHITSDYLATYGPGNSDVELAVTVTKRPVPDGSYKLVVTVACSNWIGCQPRPPLDAALDFNRTVTASWKAP